MTQAERKKTVKYSLRGHMGRRCFNCKFAARPHRIFKEQLYCAHGDMFNPWDDAPYVRVAIKGTCKNWELVKIN